VNSTVVAVIPAGVGAHDGLMTLGLGSEADRLGRAGHVVRELPVRTASLRLSGRLLPVVGCARMYVCGITPYDVTHLGHAATFVWSDVAASVLRMTGATVVACRNVTDVDDVLTAAASSHGRAYDEFALHQEYLFDKDMTALGVRHPAHEPRARHHVVQTQQLAAALLATGHGYERGGHVYFRGAAAVAQAGLSRERALALAEGHGDHLDDDLRDDPLDVPIWRPSAEHQPAWPSRWGLGRPGWHAECAAMAMSVLGAGIDILAGGADLEFPHHAYQAAMVEAATNVTPFARAQLHVGAVYSNGAKMAKSTGNLVLVADLLCDHPAAAVRLLLLNRPWWTSWEYRPGDLDQAGADLADLYAAAARPDAGGAAAAREVAAALLDDLDVPRAMSIALDRGGEAARLLVRVLSLA
jgi:L-cysteine:1D-myo-inositol 2-amino-2-deoxy-alpha-D-glucopyranoside ligase